MVQGSFNTVGSPVVTVKVSGALPGYEREFDAMIDTGFSGFLFIPMADAFSCALILAGSSTLTYADGRSETCLTLRACIEIEGQKEEGLANLDMSSDEVIVGMEFLRAFKKMLLIDAASDAAYLVSDSELRDLSK